MLELVTTAKITFMVAKVKFELQGYRFRNLLAKSELLL
jgi:hypothetical protein